MRVTRGYAHSAVRERGCNGHRLRSRMEEDCGSMQGRRGGRRAPTHRNERSSSGQGAQKEGRQSMPRTAGGRCSDGIAGSKVIAIG